MLRSLYTSGWSMLAINKQMDVISNNLANINTTAYKRDNVVFESFPSVMAKKINDTNTGSNPTTNIGKMEMGDDIGEIYTHYNQAQLVKTDNNLDLAFENSNSAFFTVAIPDKNGKLKEYYTRDGAFCLDSKRQLVTKNNGYPVMGTDGPITLKGESFSLQPDGTIVEDEKVVAKLLIKDFTDVKGLRKFGDNLLETAYNLKEQDFKGSVKQGFLEQSNVNSIREMVDMITAMRAYEANQKVVQSLEGTLDKAVADLGVVR